LLSRRSCFWGIWRFFFFFFLLFFFNFWIFFSGDVLPPLYFLARDYPSFGRCGEYRPALLLWYLFCSYMFPVGRALAGCFYFIFTGTEDPASPRDILPSPTMFSFGHASSSLIQLSMFQRCLGGPGEGERDLDPVCSAGFTGVPGPVRCRPWRKSVNHRPALLLSNARRGQTISTALCVSVYS
jgi:hypothetical protein